MANQVCFVCNERPAVVLATIIETGDTQYICLFCAPWWVQGLWEVNGLPELILDVNDQESGEAPPETAEAVATAGQSPEAATETPAMTDDEWEASGASGRPRAATEEPEQEAGPEQEPAAS